MGALTWKRSEQGGHVDVAVKPVHTQASTFDAHPHPHRWVQQSEKPPQKAPASRPVGHAQLERPKPSQSPAIQQPLSQQTRSNVFTRGQPAQVLRPKGTQHAVTNKTLQPGHMLIGTPAQPQQGPAASVPASTSQRIVRNTASTTDWPGELHQAQPALKRARLNFTSVKPGATVLGAKLLEKEAELQRLRELMQAKETALARQKEVAYQRFERARGKLEEELAAREAAEAEQAAVREAAREQQQQQQQQQADLQRRKARLATGFNAALAGVAAAGTARARQQAGPGGGGSGVGSRLSMVADAAEVSRVLQAKNDYDCLKLQAGAGLAAVRRSYKQMAVALHPDKCRLEGAIAAFQRASAAYANLIRYMA